MFCEIVNRTSGLPLGPSEAERRRIRNKEQLGNTNYDATIPFFAASRVTLNFDARGVLSG
jgi:hypothetical protein